MTSTWMMWLERSLLSSPFHGSAESTSAALLRVCYHSRARLSIRTSQLKPIHPIKFLSQSLGKVPYFFIRFPFWSSGRFCWPSLFYWSSFIHCLFFFRSFLWPSGDSFFYKDLPCHSYVDWWRFRKLHISISSFPTHKCSIWGSQLDWWIAHFVAAWVKGTRKASG